MRIEIEWWWNQAKRDFEMANRLFEAKYFDGAAYHSHQAAEKALKAFSLKEGIWHLTHSCKYMLDQLKSRNFKVDELYSCAREIDRHYLTSRYPNAASAPPYELYDEKKALELINCARLILNFVKEELKFE